MPEPQELEPRNPGRRPERVNPINILVVSVALAILMIGGASVYSAAVSASNHHSACNRSDLVLGAIEGVITLLLTPQPGQTLTGSQVKAITTAETKSFAILDAVRC